jgi:hypothetical protein
MNDGREELDDLREAVREFLAAKSPETAVRAAMETGHDPAVWDQLARQLQLPGLALPADYGGDGFGLTELGVVLEEMGAALLCSPFFGTVVLAAQALLAANDKAACERYLPGIAAGETIATLAVAESSGSWDPARIATRAERTAVIQSPLSACQDRFRSKESGPRGRSGSRSAFLRVHACRIRPAPECRQSVAANSGTQATPCARTRSTRYSRAPDARCRREEALPSGSCKNLRTRHTCRLIRYRLPGRGSSCGPASRSNARDLAVRLSRLAAVECCRPRPGRRIPRVLRRPS